MSLSLGQMLQALGPVSVEQGFELFDTKISPQWWDFALAGGHRESIQKKLQTSTGLLGFFPIGSMGNGTALTGADVDYFAVMPSWSLKSDSKATLDDVADALRARFSRTTGIRINRPGVYVPFGEDNSEPTEVIPAAYAGVTRLGYPQFLIPDDSGGWKFSAPGSHKAWVAEVDIARARRLKPLIRYLKAWKKYRNVPIKSFYLELWAASYAETQEYVLYDWSLRDIFMQLKDRGLPNLLDPRFPQDAQFLQACSSQPLWLDAYSKVCSAASWSQQAIDAKLSGRGSDALERWDLIFNRSFLA